MTGINRKYLTGQGRGRQKGFTMVELLLVLVILAVLAAIVVPKFTGRSEQARITAVRTQIAAFETSLDAFEVDNGFYPSELRFLVEQPANAPNWHGPYMKEIPLDPWGNAYIYKSPGDYNQRSYDIMSMGPDGKVGGDDDITNWRTR